MKYDIEKIKQDYTIPFVLRNFYNVELNKNSKCNCIFDDHNEKIPSFSYEKENKFFKCFGCSRGGDVIRLVELKDDLSFIEAIKKITGNRLNDYIITEKEEVINKEELKDNYKIYNYFYDLLPSEIDTNNKGYTYLRSRGINDYAINETGVKFFDKNSISIVEKELKDNFNIEILVNSGILKEKDNRYYFPFFNYPVVFPFKINNIVVGFQFRTIKEEKNYKYLIIGENKTFFNRNNFKNEYKDNLKEPIFITEGIIDCLTLISNRFQSISLTGVKKLKKKWIDYLKDCNIVYAFDNDKSGEDVLQYDKEERDLSKVNYANWYKEKEKSIKYIKWNGYKIKDINEFFLLDIENKEEKFRNMIIENDFSSYNHCKAVEETQSWMKNIIETDATKEFYTGLERLNGIGMPMRNELRIISGKSGAGKTRLSLNEVLYWLKNTNHKILIFEGEMTVESLHIMLLSIDLNIPYKKLLDKEYYSNMSEYEKKKILDFWIWFKTKTGYIYIENELNDWESIEKKIYEIKPDVFLIDTFQCINVPIKVNRTDLYYKEIAYKIKRKVLKELNCIGIIISQPSENNLGKPKNMYQREGKGITDAADFVDFIYYKYKDTNGDKGAINRVSIVRMKGRFNESDCLDFGINPESGKYYNLNIYDKND